MTLHLRKLLAFLGGLSLTACAAAQPEAVTVPAATVAPQGPALWKVADEDTTIYLFGTVHALPKDVEWFRGPIAEAIAVRLRTDMPPEESKLPDRLQLLLDDLRAQDGNI